MNVFGLYRRWLKKWLHATVTSWSKSAQLHYEVAFGTYSIECKISLSISLGNPRGFVMIVQAMVCIPNPAWPSLKNTQQMVIRYNLFDAHNFYLKSTMRGVVNCFLYLFFWRWIVEESSTRHQAAMASNQHYQFMQLWLPSDSMQSLREREGRLNDSVYTLFLPHVVISSRVQDFMLRWVHLKSSLFLL